jgi:hypothetical protein
MLHCRQRTAANRGLPDGGTRGGWHRAALRLAPASAIRAPAGSEVSFLSIRDNPPPPGDRSRGVEPDSHKIVIHRLAEPDEILRRNLEIQPLVTKRAALEGPCQHPHPLRHIEVGELESTGIVLRSVDIVVSVFEGNEAPHQPPEHEKPEARSPPRPGSGPSCAVRPWFPP